MSRHNESERAFFLSLQKYNAADDATTPREIGVFTAALGEISRRHVQRYYPDCEAC